MLKRKLLLFFAVAMIGIYAGGSCYLPSVQASASRTLDPGDTDTAPEDPGGDTGDSDTGEEPSEDPGGDSGAQTDPPSTGDDDTQEPPDSGSDSGNTGGNTGGSTGDGSSENTGGSKPSKPGGGSSSKPGGGGSSHTGGGTSSGSSGSSHTGSSTGGSGHSGSTGISGGSSSATSGGSGASSSSTGLVTGGTSAEAADTQDGEASESDSMLQSLTFSSGTLSPEFDSSTYEYTLTLDSPVTSITVHAVAFNMYSEVEGDGEIPLTAERNQIVITCTDLFGNARNYVIHLTGTALESGVIMENYRYVSDFDEETVPAEFETAQVELEGSEVAGIHSGLFAVDAVCMEDPEGNQDFYIVSNGKVTSQNVILLKLAGKEYLLMPVTIDLKLRSGFTWATAKINSRMVPGWTYNDGEKNFFQMYLRNEKQEDYIYQYDLQEDTLQIFDDDLVISSDEYQQAVNDLNKTARRENIKYTLEFLLLILAGGIVCLVLIYIQNRGDGRRVKIKRRTVNERK